MYVIAVVTPNTYTFKDFADRMNGTDISFRHIWDQERCRGVHFIGHIMLHDARDVKDFYKVMEMIKQRTLKINL